MSVGYNPTVLNQLGQSIHPSIKPTQCKGNQTKTWTHTATIASHLDVYDSARSNQPFFLTLMAAQYLAERKQIN